MAKTFDLMDPSRSLRGVATLLKTPFQEDGSLDEVSYRRQVDHVLDVGSVLLIPGMQGAETFCLTPAERRRCVEMSVTAAGDDVGVCAAVGGVGIDEVVTAARKAQELGADMVAVIPPPWMKTVEDVAACVTRVAGAVDVPVMIHSIFGGVSAMLLDAETIGELVRTCPNVRYVKAEGPRYLRQARAILKATGGLLAGMMSGPRYCLCHRAGCTLFMVAADLIDPVMAVVTAIQRGEEAEASVIDADLLAVGDYKRYVASELANKTIMKWRGIFASERLAPFQMFPMTRTLTDDERQDLAESLKPLMPYYKKYPPQPDC